MDRGVDMPPSSDGPGSGAVTRRPVSVEVIVHHHHRVQIELSEDSSLPGNHGDSLAVSNENSADISGTNHTQDTCHVIETARSDSSEDRSHDLADLKLIDPGQEEGGAALAPQFEDDPLCVSDSEDDSVSLHKVHEELIRRFDAKYSSRFQSPGTSRDLLEKILSFESALSSPPWPSDEEEDEDDDPNDDPSRPRSRPLSTRRCRHLYPRPLRQNSGTQTDDISWPTLDPIDLMYMASMTLTPVAKQPEIDPVELPFDTTVLMCECTICLGELGLYLRPCCQAAVCQQCLELYFMTRIDEGDYKMECPSCEAYVHVDEVRAVVTETKHHDLFNKKIIEANLEPGAKTCPRCSTVYKRGKVWGVGVPHPSTTTTGEHSNTTVLCWPVRCRHRQGGKPTPLPKQQGGKPTPLPKQQGGKPTPLPKQPLHQVDCVKCGLLWCFTCHAPWHTDMSCRDYQRGDRAVKQWSKQMTGDATFGTKNAQNCPKCKAFIQKISGCDHMNCRYCDTQFCYRCGERYINTRFIGKHSSRYSVLGCKYTYKPNKPVVRKLVRGGMLGGILLGVPVVTAGALVAGSVVVALAAVVLPFYGTVKLSRWLHRYRKDRMSRHRTPTMRCCFRETLCDPLGSVGGGQIDLDVTVTPRVNRPPLRFSHSLDANPALPVVDSLRLVRSASTIVR